MSFKVRALWRHYYQDTNGLNYVVNSNDRDRVEEAKSELNKMNEDGIRDAVVLACVNTLTSSTATRLEKFVTDVPKHVKLWWWNAGGTGGDSAVTGGIIQALASVAHF